ncbi:MAG: NAD(P)-dependent oxidoreductase [Planctomycetota bacterium]
MGMNIVVTGGNGKLGKHLVAELVKDHQVTVLDRAGEVPKSAAFIQGDVCDYDTCLRAFKGADVVIHLAAIPHPLSDPQPLVWKVNVTSTYNVHEAAVAAGVRRVVHASSDSTLGFCFMNKRIEPEYLPLDEKHPCKPQDSYGLSKLTGELIAQSFTRRTCLETISLRICLVLFPGVDYCLRVTRDARDKPAVDRKNLWTYNHVLDAVQAFRLAAEVETVEHEVLFISAADLLASEETMELVKRFHPAVTDIRGDLSGRKSLVDYSKAGRVLGYMPKHNWREILETPTSR